MHVLKAKSISWDSPFKFVTAEYYMYINGSVSILKNQIRIKKLVSTDKTEKSQKIYLHGSQFSTLIQSFGPG